MSLIAMADNNVNISAKMDGASYYATNGRQKDFVIFNHNESFEVTSSGLLATLGTGQGEIYGRHVVNDGSEPITFQCTANTSGYLCIRYDNTASAGHEVSFIGLTASQIQRKDLNTNTGVYDMVLYSYTASASALTLVDLRKFDNTQHARVTLSRNNTSSSQVSASNQYIPWTTLVQDDRRGAMQPSYVSGSTGNFKGITIMKDGMYKITIQLPKYGSGAVDNTIINLMDFNSNKRLAQFNYTTISQTCYAFAILELKKGQLINVCRQSNALYFQSGSIGYLDMELLNFIDTI